VFCIVYGKCPVEKVYFISVDIEVFVFIESTIFPHWRWRSSMAFPMEWNNGCKILKPTEKTSIIWNLEKYYIHTYPCKSLLLSFIPSLVNMS